MRIHLIVLFAIVAAPLLGFPSLFSGIGLMPISNAGPDICTSTKVVQLNALSIPRNGTWSIISGPDVSLSQISDLADPQATFSSTVEGQYRLVWKTIEEGQGTAIDEVEITILSSESPAIESNGIPLSQQNLPSSFMIEDVLGSFLYYRGGVTDTYLFNDDDGTQTPVLRHTTYSGSASKNNSEYISPLVQDENETILQSGVTFYLLGKDTTDIKGQLHMKGLTQCGIVHFSGQRLYYRLYQDYTTGLQDLRLFADFNAGNDEYIVKTATEAGNDILRLVFLEDRIFVLREQTIVTIHSDLEITELSYSYEEISLVTNAFLENSNKLIVFASTMEYSRRWLLLDLTTGEWDRVRINGQAIGGSYFYLKDEQYAYLYHSGPDSTFYVSRTDGTESGTAKLFGSHLIPRDSRDDFLKLSNQYMAWVDDEILYAGNMETGEFQTIGSAPINYLFSNDSGFYFTESQMPNRVLFSDGTPEGGEIALELPHNLEVKNLYWVSENYIIARIQETNVDQYIFYVVDRQTLSLTPLRADKPFYAKSGRIDSHSIQEYTHFFHERPGIAQSFFSYDRNDGFLQKVPFRDRVLFYRLLKWDDHFSLLTFSTQFSIAGPSYFFTGDNETPFLEFEPRSFSSFTIPLDDNAFVEGSSFGNVRYSQFAKGMLNTWIVDGSMILIGDTNRSDAAFVIKDAKVQRLNPDSETLSTVIDLAELGLNNTTSFAPIIRDDYLFLVNVHQGNAHQVTLLLIHLGTGELLDRLELYQIDQYQFQVESLNDGYLLNSANGAVSIFPSAEQPMSYHPWGNQLGGERAILEGTAYYFRDHQLWSRQGISQPKLVKAFEKMPLSLSPEENIHVFKNQLIFKQATPETGLELWTSDGSTTGTKPLLDLTAGPSSGRIDILGQTDNLLVFATMYNTFGLWAYDGNCVWQIDQGLATPQGERLTLVDIVEDRFLFVGIDSQNLIRMYEFDGEGLRLIENALYQRMLAVGDVDQDGILSEAEANQITVLDIEGLGLSNLVGLDQLPNLAELYASGNFIRDLAPIVAHPSLGLTENSVIDVSDNMIEAQCGYIDTLTQRVTATNSTFLWDNQHLLYTDDVISADWPIVDIRKIIAGSAVMTSNERCR